MVWDQNQNRKYSIALKQAVSKPVSVYVLNQRLTHHVASAGMQHKLYGLMICIIESRVWLM